MPAAVVVGAVGAHPRRARGRPALSRGDQSLDAAVAGLGAQPHLGLSGADPAHPQQRLLPVVRRVPEPQRRREVPSPERKPLVVRQAYGVVGAVEGERAAHRAVRRAGAAEHGRGRGTRGEVGGGGVGGPARLEPVLGEAREADLVAGVHRPGLVQQAHRLVVDGHHVGVAGPVPRDDGAAVRAVPGRAAIVGGADRHRPAAVGVGGGGQQHPVAEAEYGTLHLRGVQVREGLEGRGETVAGVTADGQGAVAEVGAVLLPAGDQERAVGAFGEGDLGRLLPERAVGGDGPGVGGPDLPVLAPVVADRERGVVGGDPLAVPGLGVDADHEPPGVAAAGELDAVHGAGRVPGVPVGRQDVGAQVARSGPVAAVVVAVLEVGSAGTGHRAAGGVRTAGVVRLHQQDPAGGAVHDRGGVAVGVAAAVVDDLERSPGASAVGGALDDDVDVPGVPAVEDAALGEGQQGVVRRPHDRRDAEAGVAPRVLVGPEEDLLLQLRRPAPGFGVGGERGGGQGEEGDEGEQWGARKRAGR